MQRFVGRDRNRIVIASFHGRTVIIFNSTSSTDVEQMRDPLDFLRSYAMHGWFVLKSLILRSCARHDRHDHDRLLYWIFLSIPSPFLISRCVSKQRRWSESSSRINQERDASYRTFQTIPFSDPRNLSKLLFFFPFFPFFFFILLPFFSSSRTRFSRTFFITLAIHPKPLNKREPQSLIIWR